MGARRYARDHEQTVGHSAEPDAELWAARKLDADLHRLATGDAPTRLELGRLLYALQSRAGTKALGFPSLKAYATQRCVQGSRWAHEAVAVARMLFDRPGLPHVAGALARGQVSWSMTQELCKYLRWYASRKDVGPEQLAARERLALETSIGKSVRAMRERLAYERRLEERGVETSTDQAGAASRDADSGEEALGADEGKLETGAATGDTDERYEPVEDERAYRRLERTIPMHEVWVLEAARNYLGAVMGEDVSDETFLDALTVGVYDCVHHAEGERVDMLMTKLDELHRRRMWADAERGRRDRAREKAEALAESTLETEHERKRRRLRSMGIELDEPKAEDEPAFEPIEWEELPRESRAIDARVIALSESLSKAELRMSVLAHRFAANRGWAQIGYASQAHYARERLGLSRQAFSELRRRGKVFDDFPELFEAVASGDLGMVAATLVARVATPDTVDAWIARARLRTVLVLRQEVEAVETAVRCGVDVAGGPPSLALLETMAMFERSVLEGVVWEDAIERIMSSVDAANGSPTDEPRQPPNADHPAADVRMSGYPAGPELESDHDSVPRGDMPAEEGGEGGDAEDAEDLQARSNVRMSGGAEGPNLDVSGFDTPRVAIRFIVPEEAAEAFEDAERLHAYADRLHDESSGRAPSSAPRMSLLAKLSLILLRSLKVDPDLLGGKWDHIYLRDRYRCQNPVCGTRKTVTPHHMKFQSHGGGDEDENLVALCPTCHLEMVHERRSLVVEPPASNMRWFIGGRDGAIMEVEGRTLRACRS